MAEYEVVLSKHESKTLMIESDAPMSDEELALLAMECTGFIPSDGVVYDMPRTVVDKHIAQDWYVKVIRQESII